VITSPIFAAGSTSAVTENSVALSGTAMQRSVLVLDIRDAGSWTGSIKVRARAQGSGQLGAAFVTYLALRNRTTDAIVAGGTGAAAAGIFEADITGLEVSLEHTRATGTVGVYAVVAEA
jgi:hypothetical protein